MAPLLRLYPFKYRDPISGTWTRARYKATLEDIRAGYAEWMIDGEPEIHGSVQSMFNLLPRWTDGAVTRPSSSNVEMQPHRGDPPGLDQVERVLVACFLRRYVTWCARSRRFAAMQGAAALLADVLRP